MSIAKISEALKGNSTFHHVKGRTARMARISALATEVLGDREKASSWLRTPNRALNGKVPLDQIETEPGCRSVEEVLYAVGHGMYS